MPFEASTSNQSEPIRLLKQRLSRFETEEGRSKGLAYQPRPNDVAITTTPKAGTTWMQQICHQLRSTGDMDFEEISEVVPWLELAYDQGQDLEAPQYGDCEGKPRIFKTHAWAEHCPPFTKTIVVFRDPNDVLLSFYRFFEDWFFEAGTVSLDDFANEFWLARDVPANKMQNASYFVHLISWYKRWENDNDSVLIFFFEDLKQDFESQIRRVARFLSTEQHDFDKPELIRLATEHSSFEFMKKHESQFDEKLSKLARNEACGLPKDAGMKGSKLVKGKSGAAKLILSQEVRGKIQQKWKAIVEPVTGCVSYDEFQKKLSSRL